MILDDTKQHIEETELSFLIGAGFSKNISPKYPSWDGLLSDAIWEMFGKGDRIYFMRCLNYTLKKFGPKNGHQLMRAVQTGWIFC